MIKSNKQEMQSAGVGGVTHMQHVTKLQTLDRPLQTQMRISTDIVATSGKHQSYHHHHHSVIIADNMFHQIMLSCSDNDV